MSAPFSHRVGELLSRYKSGPLPKAFKIIPSLPAWEDILYITGPESWTPHATLAATRIFVSNLKAQQTQKFFELVLLDKVRNEITETGKASYQTYEALKKALFKPAAFFKGILFPLCEVSAVRKSGSGASPSHSNTAAASSIIPLPRLDAPSRRRPLSLLC